MKNLLFYGSTNYGKKLSKSDNLKFIELDKHFNTHVMTLGNKRENIKPIGFVATLNKLILSTSNGRVIVIDIKSGKVDSIFKIDNEKISRPFIFDNKIILVKNDSIIRLN